MRLAPPKPEISETLKHSIRKTFALVGVESSKVDRLFTCNGSLNHRDESAAGCEGAARFVALNFGGPLAYCGHCWRFDGAVLCKSFGFLYLDSEAIIADLAAAGVASNGNSMSLEMYAGSLRFWIPRELWQ